MAESGLAKGDRVIVYGVLKQRSYETKEREKRTVAEVDVHEVGPSLLFAVAKTTKTTRPSRTSAQSYTRARPAVSRARDGSCVFRPPRR